jgi:hypothetical protein
MAMENEDAGCNGSNLYESNPTRRKFVPNTKDYSYTGPDFVDPFESFNNTYWHAYGQQQEAPYYGYGAIGIHLGISGQNGVFVEPGINREIIILYHPRTQELGVFISRGAYVHVGTPSLAGGNAYGGITHVSGLSSLEYFEGPSIDKGLTLGADAWGNLGVSATRGTAAISGNHIPARDFIDPDSGQKIETTQVSITGGGN